MLPSSPPFTGRTNRSSDEGSVNPRSCSEKEERIIIEMVTLRDNSFCPSALLRVLFCLPADFDAEMNGTALVTNDMLGSEISDSKPNLFKSC